VYVADLFFRGSELSEPDAVSHAVNNLLGALRMNGQICGREWPISILDATCRVTVLLPERDALDHIHRNRYVERAIAELLMAGLHEPNITIVGEDVDGAPSCTCLTCASYILYTNYILLESPLRCGTCFCPVPLYRVPPTADEEYHDMLAWQSDRQACDTLQMNCSTLERASMRELSRPESSLSQRGMEICAKILAASDIPTYYYLYRYGARSRGQERTRLCPGCGGSWLLATPWHLFDFKCEQCRLVSNIAWDVR
jgi:predicted  nucleic acid-binding Zn ribbon protein